MPYLVPNNKNKQNKFIDLAVNQNLTLCILAKDLLEMNEKIKRSEVSIDFKETGSLRSLFKKYWRKFFTFYSK